jgi:DNA-binding NarL/FixJ family response regulator
MSLIGTPVRIVIADDHQIFREGFKLLLKEQHELELVGEADNGQTLLKLVKEKAPDVAFVDIKMPLMDGVEACRAIKKDYPATKVIALSMFNDDYLILEMLEAGAWGYLLKNTNKEQVNYAAKAVYEGKSFYCSSTSVKLAKLIAAKRYHPYSRTKIIKLSGREIEVLQMICEQFINKEIADQLGISTRTVESYRETLLQKTDSKNAIGLVVYAIRNGIYKP